jgi:hypothetical protein
MAHTLHTMTNHIRQPVEMMVRNMETFSAPVAKLNARGMRECFWVVQEEVGCLDESHDAEVAEFVLSSDDLPSSNTTRRLCTLP